MKRSRESIFPDNIWVLVITTFEDDYNCPSETEKPRYFSSKEKASEFLREWSWSYIQDKDHYWFKIRGMGDVWGENGLEKDKINGIDIMNALQEEEGEYVESKVKFILEKIEPDMID